MRGSLTVRQRPPRHVSVRQPFCVSRLTSEGEFANAAALSGILSGSCLSTACAMPGEFDRTGCVPDRAAVFGSNSL